MGIESAPRPDEEVDTTASRLRTTISNMLGARIDFVINGVDADTRLATASRAQACAMRRRDILNGTDGEGNYNVYPGRPVQASVLAVHPRFAFIDVFGFRTRLRAKDIRSEYTEDVADVLENGQIIKVFVTQVERNPVSGEVTELFVSMRNDSAEKAELERVAANLKEGDTCRGRVSNRSRNAIFIRLNNGLQAFVYISGGLQGRSIPNIGDSVSVRVIRKVQNNNNGNPFIQGRIVRNIKYNAR
jgi:ribosomal protein S1